jgi:hypothetical protein
LPAINIVIAGLATAAQSAGGQSSPPRGVLEQGSFELNRLSASPLKLDFTPGELDFDLAFDVALGVLEDQPASAPPAPAQGGDAEALAKKLSNPVSDLISVPFQFNYDEGFGPNDAGRLTLNIQPVIPISISEDWNLILRTIVPVIYQDSIANGIDSEFGLGDTVQSFFFSPKDPIGGWIIGAGPVALWPTGTDPILRSENLGFGPTIVALRQEKGWTYGALANHVWSVYNSDSHEEVNATFLQPFLAYTWPTATTLTLNTETTYDWTAEEWNVPIALLVSQVVKIGDQPVQFQFGGRFYAESPDGGAEWGLRFTITLLFPK